MLTDYNSSFPLQNVPGHRADRRRARPHLAPRGALILRAQGQRGQAPQLRLRARLELAGPETEQGENVKFSEPVTSCDGADPDRFLPALIVQNVLLKDSIP